MRRKEREGKSIFTFGLNSLPTFFLFRITASIGFLPIKKKKATGCVCVGGGKAVWRKIFFVVVVAYYFMLDFYLFIHFSLFGFLLFYFQKCFGFL